jgi:hypothetical protein
MQERPEGVGITEQAGQFQTLLAQSGEIDRRQT